MANITLTVPPPGQTVQAPRAIPPHSASAPGPDNDEDEGEMSVLYTPALIARVFADPERTPLMLLQASVDPVATEMCYTTPIRIVR